MRSGHTQHRSAALLDEFSQSLRNFLGADNPQHLASPYDEWRPATDIKQNAERYLLEVELPGISRQDIKVQVVNRELTIHCSRADSVSPSSGEGDQSEDRVVRRERHLGSFGRHFRLPEDADAQRISAKTEDGVLYVRVPRKGTTEIQGIDVN